MTLSCETIIDVRAPGGLHAWNVKLREESELCSRTYAIDNDMSAMTLN